MKRVITFILMSLMLMSLFTMPVYATEQGSVISGSTGEGTVVDAEDPYWDGNAGAASASTETKKENNETGPQYGSMADTRGEQSNTATTNPVNPNAQADGEGMVVLTIDTTAHNPELDVLIQLYNRNSGKIIDVPCYKTNKLISKHTVPAGSYMIYNVIVDGDNAKNPKWVYKIGDIVEVPKGDTVYFTIKLLSSPKGEVAKDDTTSTPEGPVTDTNINGVENESTGFTRAWDLFKGRFSGFNFVLIVAVVGAAVAYIVIKKKKDED